jgi:hypothetical protein
VWVEVLANSGSEPAQWLPVEIVQDGGLLSKWLGGGASPGQQSARERSNTTVIEGAIEGCLRVSALLFKDTQRYFLKATTPCVIAYDYARIRRLVRLGRGFYRFRVTENSDRVW